MDFPEQLKRKDGDDEQEEDVLPVSLGQGKRPFINMNQSIFGIIAAAGPKVDFHNRFEGQSSDEEDADDSDETKHNQGAKKDAAADPMAQTTILVKPGSKGHRSHWRKFSEGKLVNSVPMLSRLSSKSRSSKESKKSVSQIQEESEPELLAGDTSAIPTIAENSLAPVMSRMLEAQAEAAARPSFDLERRSTDKAREASDLTDTGPKKLSKGLQKIFEFDEPEELISGRSSMTTRKR